MYGKEILELENVRQILQNNELMKKTDSIEEASGLFVKSQKGRSKSRGPKRDLEASSTYLLLLQETRAHQEKLYEI